MINSYPTRPTVCEINLQALKDNFRLIRKQIGKKRDFLAVVKADAYGHGAVEISKTLEELGVDMLGVAILEEALQLRKEGINTPILILGGILEGQEKAILSHELTPVIFSIATAKRINEEASKKGIKIKVHIKIDTGMGRIGLQPQEVKHFFTALKKMEAIEVEGLLTHFASADFLSGSPQEIFSKKQIETFKATINDIEEMGFNLPIKHAANSAAIFNLSDGCFNMVRPGIMLYGCYPGQSFKEMVSLKGVMSLKTEIIDLKEVEKGFTVSYGGTYIAPDKRKIAVLPIGYADGYKRELSGKGEVTIKGERVPVIGRICMDMTMIDVTNINNVQVGDTVYLFGGEGDNPITVDEIADKAGTIAYEILCGISQRVPKFYKLS